MALPPDVLPLVRQFASNGFRYLLRQRDNVADLVRWREPKIARGIDFGHLEVQPETFIAPSFAQLESDILLRAPFSLRGDRVGKVEVYILIEHQSEPDEMMLFRVVRYVVLVYERQAADWLRTHPNLRRFRFSPVLPIIFYTGKRTWNRPTEMVDLVKYGKHFARRLPTLEPEFIDLARTEATDLQGKGGLFGWVLWLIQHRKAGEARFREVLQEVVHQIDEVHESQRGRWESLLWYLHALVYHDRGGGEHQPLTEFIRSTVRKANQPEVILMGKTIAQTLEEKGARDAFMFQLQEKFEDIPEGIVAEIESTTDERQLRAWLKAILTANTLADMPFKSRPRGNSSPGG